MGEGTWEEKQAVCQLVGKICKPSIHIIELLAICCKDAESYGKSFETNCRKLLRSTVLETVGSWFAAGLSLDDCQAAGLSCVASLNCITTKELGTVMRSLGQ